VFYNHPGFIEAMRDRVQQALDQLPEAQRGNAHLVFTAHSIPKSMASACSYETQLRQACQLVCEAFESNPWELVYQSRSGPPHIPWLEPDVCDYLDELKTRNIEAAVIAPIGFLSDHLEVLFDLDIEAKQKAQQLEIPMVRAGTVGTHPKFIAMIRQLIQERLELDDTNIVRLALGSGGAEHDTCLLDCCPAPVSGTRPAGASDQKPGMGHPQD